MYLNGELHLWQKSSSNGYEEVDKRISPALMDPYVLHKTLIHKMTQLMMILDALIKKEISWANMYQQLNLVDTELKELLSCLAKDNMELPYLDLLNPSIALILQAKACSSQESLKQMLDKYFCIMQPVIARYSKKSTDIQLAGLHKVMELWVSDYYLRWDTSRVLIVGPQGPREGMIEKQYFEDCYKKNVPAAVEPVERIIYVESPPDLMSSIKIPTLIENLGKHLLNRSIGLFALGNVNAMNKDVLAPYAPDVLERLPPLPVQSDNGMCPYKI